MTEPATMTVPQAAELLGVSRNAAYQAARRDGHLAGVPVIRIGERRLVIPRAPFEIVLGIASESIDIDTPEAT
jgi:hypothetical protein